MKMEIMPEDVQEIVVHEVNQALTALEDKIRRLDWHICDEDGGMIVTGESKEIWKGDIVWVELEEVKDLIQKAKQ